MFNDSKWRRDFLGETSMTKGFTKAVETLKKVQLKQQELRKKFVDEKNPKQKEKYRKEIIKMHKIVQKAEEDFNRAVINEPIDDLGEI